VSWEQELSKNEAMAAGIALGRRDTAVLYIVSRRRSDTVRGNRPSNPETIYPRSYDKGISPFPSGVPGALNI
jgi:hypothetical protein